jgi:nitrogen regulatory protein PII
VAALEGAIWLIGLAIVVERALHAVVLMLRSRAGKVSVSPVDTIIRVRTGEMDHDAI